MIFGNPEYFSNWKNPLRVAAFAYGGFFCNISFTDGIDWSLMAMALPIIFVSLEESRVKFVVLFEKQVGPTDEIDRVRKNVNFIFYLAYSFVLAFGPAHIFVSRLNPSAWSYLPLVVVVCYLAYRLMVSRIEKELQRLNGSGA